MDFVPPTEEAKKRGLAPSVCGLALSAILLCLPGCAGVRDHGVRSAAWVCPGSAGPDLTPFAPQSAGDCVIIQWKYVGWENCVYLVEPGAANSINIRLFFRGDKITDRQTQWSGGFEGFRKVCEAAIGDFAQAPKVEDPKGMVCRLSIVLKSPASRAESTASRESFNNLFERASALRQVVEAVSEGQPKMYRIIDTPGPHKQWMRLPAD